MRALRLDPLGQASYHDVEDSPTAWQDLLGGYMEVFPLPVILGNRGLIGLADEEGLLKELPHNVYSPLLGRPIVGPAVIVRSDPPEFVSLTDNDVAVLDEWFGRMIVVVLPE